jgi:hypothetical protein
MDDKPFQEPFGHMTRFQADWACEAPERIVAREGEAGRIWRLSGMDIRPACRAVRDAFFPEGRDGPTARYCRLRKVLEVVGPGGSLLARRDSGGETNALLALLAECELSPLDEDDEVEY